MCVALHPPTLASLDTAMKFPKDKIETDEDGNLLFIYMDKDTQNWACCKIGTLVDCSTSGHAMLHFKTPVKADVRSSDVYLNGSYRSRGKEHIVVVPVEPQSPPEPSLFRSGGISLD